MFAIEDDASGASGLTEYTRSRQLKCNGRQWCDEIVILHLGHLIYSKLRVEVVFHGLPSSFNISDVVFDVSAYIF